MNLTHSFLDQARLTTDEPADELVSRFFSSGRMKDLYQTLSANTDDVANSSGGNDITDFMLGGTEEPAWYSAEKIESGQAIFAEYATEIMTLLGAYSLPYCYAGSPGNKALYLSEKMRKNPGKRLFDTAEFVISVSTSGNLTRNKIGLIQINKTRLIHAIARAYTFKYGWNMQWGAPVNQEDMAGTNLAFSYIILNGLRKSGITLTEKQNEDYLFLWRYIGYQNGILEDLLPANYLEASQLTNVIKRRNFTHSKEGKELTRELLDYYRKVAPSSQANFVESQVRYYLGEKISAYLGLSPDPIKDVVTDMVNTFNSLKNSFSSHTSSYGEMIRNFEKQKRLAH